MSENGFQLTAFGELFAELYPRREGSALVYVPVPGAGPAKMACAAARLGCRTAFFGKAGEDPLGGLLKDTLAADGIALENLVRSRQTPTPAVLIQEGGEGIRRYREGAGPRLEEFDLHPIARSEYFYFAAASGPAAKDSTWETGLCMARYARSHGGTVVFSPDIHPDQWKTKTHGEKEAVREQCRRALKLSQVVKATAEELAFMMDEPNPDQAAARLMLRYRPKILLVTLDDGDCFFRSVYGDLRLPGFPAEGEASGDVFMGAFLSRLASNGKALIDCGIGDIAACAVFACAAAALAADFHRLPSLEQAEEFLQRHLI